MILFAIDPVNVTQSNNITHHQFFVDGPAGKIEALLSVPKKQNALQAVAVVCHPHPLHQGSMNNKVTYTIAKTYNDLGVPALRFNFRGVGESDGEFANAIGEEQDLIAVCKKLREVFPSEELWLAGFSFGAYIALRSHDKVGAEKLVTVAPAIHLYDFSDIQLPAYPWLLIQGDEDEIVPADQVIEWVKNLRNPPELVIAEGVGHFFHRRLGDIKAAIENYILN